MSDQDKSARPTDQAPVAWNVSEDEEGNAVVELWRGNKKLTFFTVSKPDEALLKSWGPNMHSDMEFVPIRPYKHVLDAFEWLYAAPPEPQPAPEAHNLSQIETEALHRALVKSVKFIDAAPEVARYGLALDAALKRKSTS